jgi:hypothetical protein
MAARGMTNDQDNNYRPSWMDHQNDAVELALQISRRMTLEHQPTDPIVLRPNRRTAVDEAIQRVRELAEDASGNH